MEARLAAPKEVGVVPDVSGREQESGTEMEAVFRDVAVAVEVAPMNGTESESINVWPDEAAEASFRAEARERGEPVAIVPAVPKIDATEEADPTKLPPLEELVNRIPAEVREALDDLFRAKFTAVRRLPKKSFGRS